MTDREPASLPNRWQVFSAFLLICGLGLVALPFVWPRTSSSRAAWSDEQARKYQAAAADLHRLSHEYARDIERGNSRDVRDKLQQAQQEYGQLRAELDSAMARPKHIALRLRVVGVALAVAGAVGFYYGRPLRRDPDQ